MDSYRIELRINTEHTEGYDRQRLLQEMEINIREALLAIEKVRSIPKYHVGWIMKRRKENE